MRDGVADALGASASTGFAATVCGRAPLAGVVPDAAAAGADFGVVRVAVPGAAAFVDGWTTAAAGAAAAAVSVERGTSVAEYGV